MSAQSQPPSLYFTSTVYSIFHGLVVCRMVSLISDISSTLAPRYRYQHLYVSILTGSALEIAITCVARVKMLSDQKFIQRYGHGQNSDFFGKNLSIAMSCLNILQICWRTRWFCSQSELKGNQQYIHLIEPPSISCPISGAYSDWNWEDVP